MLTLDVNADAFVVLSNKLDRLSKSALPNAVRNTLNSTAFHVKKDTMLKHADKVFDKRQANFFRANSKVEMATGFDVNMMESRIGFFDNNLKNKSTNFAVKDLEKQEHGGQIGGRSFIPLNKARIGNSYLKNVRKDNRIGNLLNQDESIVHQRKIRGKSPGHKFKIAVKRAGRGGFVLGDYKGKRILWRVNSMDMTADGKYKLTAIATYKKGRSVKVKATHFMRDASFQAAKKMEHFFIKNAEFQINKFWHR